MNDNSEHLTPIIAGEPPTDAGRSSTWVPLVSVARLESGHTPSRKRPDWWGGSVPWLALPDIRALHGTVAITTAESINEAGLTNSSARLLPAGTVCVSRTASIGFVTLLGRAMATSQDFCNWICDPAHLDPEYLQLAFLASRSHLLSLGSGAVHKTIYMPTIRTFHVRMHGLDRQRQICLAIRARLALVADQSKNVAGQLSDAACLIRALLRESFGNVPPVSVDGAVTEAPSRWARVRLLSIARLESGHTPSRRRPEWWGGPVPWLALPDIRKLHGKLAHQTTETINDVGLANSSARLLPVGTVCVSRTASIGFVTLLGRPMATSQDFCNWVCDPERLDPEFLMYAFMASQDSLRELGSGAVHKTIYMPTIQSFHISAPGIDEQRRIAHTLREQLAAAEALQSRLAERQADIERLPQRILAAAFGEAD